MKRHSSSSSSSVCVCVCVCVPVSGPLACRGGCQLTATDVGLLLTTAGVTSRGDVDGATYSQYCCNTVLVDRTQFSSVKRVNRGWQNATIQYEKYIVGKPTYRRLYNIRNKSVNDEDIARSPSWHLYWTNMNKCLWITDKSFWHCLLLLR